MNPRQLLTSDDWIGFLGNLKRRKKSNNDHKNNKEKKRKNTPVTLRKEKKS